MTHVLVADHTLHKGHEDGTSRLVVGTKERCAVGGDDGLAHTLGKMSALRC